jgi:hypothetical protein
VCAPVAISWIPGFVVRTLYLIGERGEIMAQGG